MPPRHGPDHEVDRGAIGRDQGEVTVVAGRDDGLPDGGVDVAPGQLGRPERNRHRLGQQRAHRDRPAVGLIELGQLGVGPEPAAGGVQRGQVGFEQGAGGVQRAGFGDGQMHQAAE